MTTSTRRWPQNRGLVDSLFAPVAAHLDRLLEPNLGDAVDDFAKFPLIANARIGDPTEAWTDTAQS